MPAKYLRDGTYDAEIAKEIKSAYGWMNVKDQVVLDIGACFGAAAVAFVELGARHVICVEPEPDNLKQLKRNTQGMPVTIVPGAVTASEKTAELYLNAGINTGGHSLHVKRGRSSLSVSGLPFRTLLKTHKPSRLKVDCEGAEYDFVTEPLPRYVKQVAMEIHLNKKIWRERAEALVGLFADWEVIKAPNIGPRNWHTIGGWSRK